MFCLFALCIPHFRTFLKQEMSLHSRHTKRERQLLVSIIKETNESFDICRNASASLYLYVCMCIYIYIFICIWQMYLLCSAVAWLVYCLLFIVHLALQAAHQSVPEERLILLEYMLYVRMKCVSACVCVSVCLWHLSDRLRTTFICIKCIL